MAVVDQVDSTFAATLHVMDFALVDQAGGPLDLTGRILKFSLSKFRADQPTVPKQVPFLDLSSAVDTDQVEVVGDPTEGNARVTLVPDDTADLANAGPTDYHFQLECFEPADEDPVMLATGTLTVNVNHDNEATP